MLKLHNLFLQPTDITVLVLHLNLEILELEFQIFNLFATLGVGCSIREDLEPVKSLQFESALDIFGDEVDDQQSLVQLMRVYIRL